MKEKMGNRIMMLVSFVLLALTISAQEFDQMLNHGTSNDGNYIYLHTDSSDNNPEIYKNTKQFIVKRIKYDSAAFDKMADINEVAKKSKTIGTAKALSKSTKVSNLFSGKSTAELEEMLGIKDSIPLLTYIQKGEIPDYYGLNYYSLTFRRALGHVFLDDDVEKDQVYLYLVIREENNGTLHQWGNAFVKSKVGNPWIHKLKPEVSYIKAYDSSIVVSWEVYVPPDLTMNTEWVDDNSDLGGLQESFYTMPFQPEVLQGYIVSQVKDGPILTSEMQLASSNATGDTLTFSTYSPMNPEQTFTAYMVLQDELNNKGVNSDTAYVHAIAENYLPIIYGIRTRKITDGAMVAWDALPVKDFIAGVEIKRSTSNSDSFVTLATMPPTDTSYSDFDMDPGVIYHYQVRALYLPSVQHEQKIPASGNIAPTIFATPTAPHGLVGLTEGPHVRLNWKQAKEKTTYGYYIYRGTGSETMEYLDGPILEKSYLDTSKTLSGKGRYFYAVTALNHNQDEGFPSNSVEVVPNRKLVFDAPGTMKFYLANGLLRIEWQDTREINNAISSFILQKRNLNTGTFETVSAAKITKASFIDSFFVAGEKLDYKVASVDYKGNIGSFSRVFSFRYENKKAIGYIEEFYVSNSTQGVQVVVPTVLYTSRKDIQVFRRGVNETPEQFVKIGSIDQEKFYLIDKTVEEGQGYVYTLKIVNIEDIEGNYGSSRTILFERPVLEE